MARARKAPEMEMGINMTPMIDIVFQLIIFFIVVIDMSQKELEDLKLPIAKAAAKDEQTQGRPILNVTYDGKILVKREPIYDPESSDPLLASRDNLEVWLKGRARQMPKKFDKTVGAELPDDPVLVRADKNTPFKWIQLLMESCAKQGIQIWKIELAATEYKSELEEEYRSGR
jgi:biopolymer transport protein ExbD